jgi:sterol desaturase/sphingolipid hydroxylase (fatty acid hydroxylase superfamily)
MNTILDWLGRAPAHHAVGVMLLENVGLLLVTLLAGELLMWLFATRRASPLPPPLTRAEVSLAALCVLMNTLVTIAGWWLWRHGFITVRRDTGPRAWADVLVLLLAMDLGMYLTHRVAHWPPIFRLLHAPHHQYDHPRPLNLFVLHPLEVLGFGSLWLLVMWLYPASWLGTCVYLTLNLAFGLVGHLGVEPFPRAWARWWLARHVGSSTFHAEHHVRQRYNFGFYTLIWDRLFGTLDPRYVADFEQGIR